MTLLKPIITESSILAAQSGRFSFAVVKGARKPEIKQAIESVYGVTVTKVVTAKIPPKSYRTGKRRLTAHTTAGKKAIVELKQGQTIDLFDFGDEHNHA